MTSVRNYSLGVVLLVCLLGINAGVLALNAGEVEALKDMQLEWGQQLGWAGVPSCDWRGISCDQAGHVTFLELSSNQLTGSIPDSIGQLGQLNVLDLSFNQLNGSIPDSIGNLGQLHSLDLSFNQLNGSIPDSIGNLGQLRYLHLSSNQLTGSIPDSIGNLGQLYSLHLSSNQLTGSIPDSIGNLGQLGFLDLSSNQLTGLVPSSLCFHSYFVFYITGNAFQCPLPQCCTSSTCGTCTNVTAPSPPPSTSSNDCCVYTNATTHAAAGVQCAATGGCVSLSDLNMLAMSQDDDCGGCFAYIQPLVVQQFDCCAYTNATHKLAGVECAPRGKCVETPELAIVAAVSDCSKCFK